MLYENELHLLCDTFRRCHVQAAPCALDEPIDTVPAPQAGEEGERALREVTVRELFGAMAHGTLYKKSNAFGLCYLALLLPPPATHPALAVGPYLRAPLSSRRLLEIGEAHGITPKSQRYLEEYYAAIPVVGEESPLLTLLESFCERIWGTPSYAVVDVNADEGTAPASPINEAMHTDSFDEVLVNMKALEKRYEYENELIQAVTHGQTGKETQFLSAFSEAAMERRTADPLRNIKNYCIIMNTLLRKAAEAGGVHPMYIDRVSSDLARKIEGLSASAEGGGLMRDMYRAYCRLVRKHSMKRYSHVVEKTVLLIDADLAADLSLRSLAESQGISAGYLSTVFKKETGKTVSEYIREKRVKHAAHLLSTTHLQVQTVALHCGIVDVQYFSKIFKKQTGKTPREYREDARQK